MLPGVYQAIKKDGTIYFRSGIHYKNKHISLGSFANEQKAHHAYTEARQILSERSYTITDRFPIHSTLSFEKRISLINFKDNQIYFKNPIYLKNRFFIYYLSPNEELKFDIDDLFYYASHKIMRRNGHLFVSDYGMQINILSRYGIKNYGVPGKDYIFSNGDSTDFRYSNIRVINKYYGVTKIYKQKIPCYKVKIHLNSSLVIGTYEDEDHAAIAYNKAVDTARKHGIKKNFQTNYILNYSAKKYAEIYVNIKISDRYVNYLRSQPHD